MGWRVQLSVQSITVTDFVYGLGNIGLVTHLECWIGITAACLPTLSPLYSKYFAPVLSRGSGHQGKGNGQRQLKEAKHTIGSGDKRGFNRKDFTLLSRDSLLQLEEGKNFSTAEASQTPISVNGEDESHWMNDLNAINVRHDVQVYGGRQGD